MKNSDPLITRSVLESVLDDRFEKFERKIDERARGYRDDVLNKMDEVIGELSQIREDQVFINHDIKNHEERITKLEKVTQTQ